MPEVYAYGFKYDTARRLAGMLPGRLGKRSERSEDAELYPCQLAVTDGIASAAGVTGQLVECTVQLLNFDPSASPATATSTDLNTRTAWNPFTEDIPDGTYVIITKVPNGWIITQVLNYCP